MLQGAKSVVPVVAWGDHILLPTMTCGVLGVLTDLTGTLALLVARLIVVGLALLVVGRALLGHHEVALAWEVGIPHGRVVISTWVPVVDWGPTVACITASSTP